MCKKEPILDKIMSTQQNHLNILFRAGFLFLSQASNFLISNRHLWHFVNTTMYLQSIFLFQMSACPERKLNCPCPFPESKYISNLQRPVSHYQLLVFS